MGQIRACVTGAAGFIGNHLCRYLQERDYWVRGVDYREPRFGDVAANEVDWQCDLRSYASAHRALTGIDHVYALAADMGGMGFISVNHYRIIHNNALVNLNTAEAARLCGVSRLLFSSSACVYPTCLQALPDASPLREDDAWMGSPEDAYGIEKLMAEEIYKRLAEKAGIEVRVARFHNIFGPEGSYDGGREKLPAAACRKVAEAIQRGRPYVVNVWGDGKARRSFCYIDDCLEMLYLLMNSDHAGPMNIGTDRSVSVDGVFDAVAEIAGVAIVKAHSPGPQGVRGRNADLTLMRGVLGYEPQVSLEEGLARLYEWVSIQVTRKAQ